LPTTLAPAVLVSWVSSAVESSTAFGWLLLVATATRKALSGAFLVTTVLLEIAAPFVFM